MYVKTNWIDVPDPELATTEPKLNALNLNKIEQGIFNSAEKSALDVANRKIKALFDLTQGQAWDFDRDDNNLYRVSVPSGAKLATVQKYGGKSIVWNQRLPHTASSKTSYGITFTNNNDGSWTVNGTLNGEFAFVNLDIESGVIKHYIGHKYYCGGASNRVAVQIVHDGGVVLSFDGEQIKTLTTTITSTRSWTRIMTTDTGQFVNYRITPQLFDLTQMFGAGNEPSTVAEVKALLPNDYYAFNTGEVIHASIDKVVEQGVNVWNEETKFGYYDASDGTYKSGSSQLCSNGYTEVIGNTNYYCVGGSKRICFYDSSKSFLSVTGWLANGVITTPSNARYITITLGGSYGTTYNNDISINRISTDTSYHSYRHNEYPIPQAIKSLEGYGWSAGNAYNEVDFERKKFIKRVGRVDLGSLTWSKSSTYSELFYSTISGCKTDTSSGAGVHSLCGKYENYIGLFSNMPDKSNRCGGRYISSTINGELLIKDSDYSSSTASAFKTAMNGVYLYYELATPIEIDITDILEPFNVEDGGTITFHNSNGDGYGIPVPSTEEYLVKLEEVG